MENEFHETHENKSRNKVTYITNTGMFFVSFFIFLKKLLTDTAKNRNKKASFTFVINDQELRYY